MTNALIQKTVTYPSGKNSIIRHIAEERSVPIDAARSLFHMCNEHRADTSVTDSVTKALATSEEEWNVYLESVLAEIIESGQILPNNLFMTTYPQTGQIFEQFLKMQTVSQTSPWRKNISVKHIDQNMLTPFVTTATGLDFDIFLAIETFFLSRFL